MPAAALHQVVVPIVLCCAGVRGFVRRCVGFSEGVRRWVEVSDREAGSLEHHGIRPRVLNSIHGRTSRTAKNLIYSYTHKEARSLVAFKRRSHQGACGEGPPFAMIGDRHRHGRNQHSLRTHRYETSCQSSPHSTITDLYIQTYFGYFDTLITTSLRSQSRSRLRSNLHPHSTTAEEQESP